MAPFVAPKIYRKTVQNPNLGLYLDRFQLSLPDRAMKDCLNVRIQEGRIKNANMGWDKLAGIDTPLNGQVLLIDEFRERSGGTTLIFGTKLDLYEYNPVTEVVTFITPIYNNGTVAVVNGSPTVTFTCSPPFVDPDDIKEGDFISVGANDENDPDAIWYEIQSVDDGAQTVTLTENYAESSDPTAVYTVRHVFTGDDSNIWSSDTFPDAQPADEDEWWATNGLEIVNWNGSDDTVTLQDMGWTCRYIRYWKNMLLFADITESGEYRPASIINSALGQPAETAADEASEFVVGDGINPILCLEPLADVLFAYLAGTGSIEILEWLDAPVYWAIRTGAIDLPILSPRSIVNQGDYHQFMTRTLVYRFDGVQLVPTGSHTFRGALRTLDPARSVKALAYCDRENADAFFVIPKTTDSVTEMAGPKHAYVEHYLEPVGRNPQPITKREIPATAIGSFERTGKIRFSDLTVEQWKYYNYRWNDRFFAAEFPQIIFGTEDGYVYTLNSSDVQDGAVTTSSVELPRIVVADGDAIGLVKRIEFFMGKRTTHDNFGYTLYGQDYADAPNYGTNTRSGTYDLSMSGSSWIKPRMKGRFLDIIIGSSSSDPSPWECSGYTVESIQGGRRR